MSEYLFIEARVDTTIWYEVPDELGIDVLASLLPGPAQAEHATTDKDLAFCVLDYLSLRGTNDICKYAFNTTLKL